MSATRARLVPESTVSAGRWLDLTLAAEGRTVGADRGHTCNGTANDQDSNACERSNV
jgi:hypothetical protein